MTDACPTDPDKLEPGECGCGVPEACAPLKAALLHRYSFTQDGASAVDSIGNKNGTIVGVVANQGKVTFDGTSAAYVDLPNGMISVLKDASFEVWFTWGGGSAWQRIFDFGNNDQAEGQQGTCATYIYLCPMDGFNAMSSAFNEALGTPENIARASATLPTGSAQHLVVVADDTQNRLRVYLNGSLAAQSEFTDSLSRIQDVNNWLGRSNCKDPPLKGSIDEFRIYNVALDASQILASYRFGPNPSFLTSSGR